MIGSEFLSLDLPNAGLEEPALGGSVRESTQRRLFAAASSDAPADFAAALLWMRTPIDSSVTT
jgi:hypothetical protein